MVDGWSWVFIAGIVLAAASGVGVAVLAWRSRDTDRALGVLFAVLAVASTINITLIGHRMRMFQEQTDARLTCLEQHGC